MQALDDLKNDIQTLIDTTASTIQQLVDQASRNAAAAVPATSGPDTADVFTSQLMDLSSKVRAATDNLRNQASAILNQSSGGSSGPDSGGEPPAGGTSIGPSSFKAPG